ncbi:PAS domain S-box protein [Segetibacter sp. 3557_3]|uniref:PAS domain S-box protein n=1 Tax=Segetibacter sp. 3557_3 TaxID=2547429 RepID=UPI001058F663|nr:PAS domain S-box protein [Segetibacter sp. 3557_3]TDH24617.1 PAS domain S-box protein [Segetibacter sp. 3557_3]
MTYDSIPFQLAETSYIALFEALPGNHVLVQNDPPRFTILAVTPGYLKQTDLSKAALIGKGVFEAFDVTSCANRNAGKELLLSYQHVCQQGQPHFLPMQRYDLKNDDGTFTEKYWRVSNAPVTAPDGEVKYVLHTSEDITELVRAERREAGIKGMEMVNNLFRQTPVAVCLLKGADLVIELANEPALKLWHITNDAIGLPLRQAVPEIQDQGYADMIDSVMTTGMAKRLYESPVTLTRDGIPEIAYINFDYEPYYEGNNTTVVGVLTIGNDVTEKVLAQKRVEESETKYRALFDSMDQGFCVLEIIFNESNTPINYRFVEANPMFEKQTGLVGAIGKTARELVPDLEPHWFELYGRVALTGEAKRFNEGSKAMGKWFDVFAFRIGEPGSLRVALLFTDITERKRSEEALIEKDRQLRNIIHSAPVAMLILRGEEMIVDTINERMIQMIGKNISLLNRPLLETIPELKGQDGYERILSVYKTGKAEYGNEVLVPLMREGVSEERYFNFSYTPIIEDETIVGVMDVATEVTEQVKARKVIEEKGHELQLAIDVASLGHYRVDLLNDVASCSTRLLNWFGIEGQDLRTATLLDQVHPGDRSRFMAAFRNATPTEANEPIDIIFRVVDPCDGTLRHLRSFNKIRFDDYDRAYLVFGVVQDVTQEMVYQQHLKESEAELQRRVLERTLELENLNDELKRSNQNLEEFAYAASHDLKEPIRKIHFFTHQLKNQLHTQLLENQKWAFSRIENATDRMGNLIDDLLLYSHVSQRPREIERVDLNQKVHRVLEDLEVDIAEKKAAIRIGKLPVVQGHGRQLQQLLQNLVSNALKYSRPDVPLHIDITASQVEENGRMYHQLTITDNGIGFKQEYAHRIFQMFIRLHGKAEYSGTGVGLSIVKKVVENHKGFIQVDSTPDVGSTFRIFLSCEL